MKIKSGQGRYVVIIALLKTDVKEKVKKYISSHIYGI